jgi:POT family proton-dependent oligopeptide transporter
MLMGIGFAAVAFLLMAYAGVIGGDTGRVSVQWLIWANVIIALGEICLSPMGMSLVNRLAPPRLRGMMMGAWYVSLSLGGYASGAIGVYWEQLPHSRFFMMVAGVLAVAAVPLSFLTPRIKRTIGRAEAAHVPAAH